MKKIITLFFISVCTYAQHVGINTTDPKAMLDIERHNNNAFVSGLLVPRLTRAEAQTMNNVKESTLIYVTEVVTGTATGTTTLVTAPGFYYFATATNRWTRLGSEQQLARNIVGDVKHGAQKADHNGWYLLNGREVSTLPSPAQAGAAQLGLTNLPDATMRLLVQPNGSPVGSISGSNTPISFAITQDNLPNFNFTGSTDSAGEHTHGLNRNRDFIRGLKLTNRIVGQYNYNYKNPYRVYDRRITANNAGAHTHSVSFTVDGSSTPITINKESAYVSANAFVYLGE